MKRAFILFCLFPFFLSCEKYDDIPDDPQVAILGKWKVVETINRAQEKHKFGDMIYQIHEFYADGISKVTYYDSENVQYGEVLSSYRMDSHYLYTKSPKADWDRGDISVDKYYFYQDKLRLDYVSGVIEDSMMAIVVCVLQRVK